MTINEIVFEVGSGHGHFLTKYAAQHPNRLFVGIDLLGDRLYKAGRKQSIAGLANLRFVKAEAVEFLSCLPDRIRIAETWILFPDPWPKKRHHKNRLIQPSFLSLLAARMDPGGRLYFRSDHEPYVEWCRETLRTHACWRVIDDAVWPFEEKTVFQARAPGFGSIAAEIKTPSSPEKPTD